MKFVCNMLTNSGFHQTEIELDSRPEVGKVIDYHGDIWKVVGIYRDSNELWLRQLGETGKII